MPNPNTLYANTFVDALIAAGLRRVCLAPGSRHTPLVLALARHRDAIELSSHLDERSAAFFALGLAMGSGEPAAVVCTSGSAAANFFPAIVEAHQSRLPLIVLTADRPHESRHSGANQTIDQVKIYGDYADFFVDAPLPEADPPPVALRNLRTLAAQAFHAAAQKRGVVHINLPFRKPFEPGDEDTAVMRIHQPTPTRFVETGSGKTSGLPSLLSEDVLKRRGIIYFGHGSCRTEAERHALMPWAQRLSERTGYPLLAEFTSNMRSTGSIGAYESLITSEEAGFQEVEVLIRFGAPPLCKHMQDFLARDQLRYHIFCSRAGEWADDTHSITHHLEINPAEALADEWQTPRGFQSSDNAWRKRMARAEQTTWQVVRREVEAGAYFDGAVLHDLVDLIPGGSSLFAGNSLPVRHLDQYGMPSDKPIFAYANRGASGIDGNVSTALGVGAARSGQPLVAVLGDITLYHDMNGLLAVQRCGVPVTIVLLNNDGGGIFQRLPVRDYEPHFSDFFITAHGLDFAQTARLYGLDYVRADDRASFRRAFSQSVSGQQSTLIEVRTDARADLKRRADIMAAVRGQLQTLET